MRPLHLSVVGLASLLLAGSGAARAASDSPEDVAPLVDGRQYTVSYVRCNTAYGSAGAEQLFAEQKFPAHTAFSLSRVSVLAPARAGAPAGYAYEKVTDGVFVKDGAVAVSCGTTESRRFAGVWLVSPRAYRLDLDSADPWR